MSLRLRPSLSVAMSDTAVYRAAGRMGATTSPRKDNSLNECGEAPRNSIVDSGRLLCP